MRYFLNIGLEVSRHYADRAHGAERLVPGHVLAVIRTAIPTATVRRAQVLPANDKSEPTLVVDVHTSAPVSPMRWDVLADELLQDAVAVVTKGGPGELYGPRAAEWGPFNADYFRQFED